jgi:ketosteroid isomerase-like protein
MGKHGDVVRLCYRRLNAGDIHGWLQTLSPRIEWHDLKEIPGSRTYRGRDEARELGQNLTELSQTLRFTINELRERDDGSVLADVYVDVASEGAAEFGWRAWTVWRIKEEMVRYHHSYSEREAALADFEGDDAAPGDSEGGGEPD